MQPCCIFYCLHFYLFGGRTGLIVNGVGAILTALLCLTGLFIWWPGRRQWTQALRINSNAGWKRFNWDLHSAGGFWTIAFLSMWAVTGAYFAFPQQFATAIAAVLPMSAPPPPAIVPPGNPAPAPVDALVARARAEAPGHRVTWIGLPHHEDDNLATIYLVPAESDDSFHTTHVFLNPFTAEVLKVARPADQTVGDKVLMWFVSLHFGNFGGWPVKALWLVLGLTPAALFVTGFLMWWNRVLSKRWNRRNQPTRENVREPELVA